MENKPVLSIRELTEIIRNCQSAPEIERFISNIRTEFDSHSISDQAFLLAMIGVTLMTITATPDPLDHDMGKMHLSRLLSAVNWKGNDNLN